MLKKDRLMAFAVFAYFAELIPVSQIIPHHELLADHYLYLPIMSFGLLVALAFNWMLQRGRRPRLLAYWLVAGYLLVLAGSTVSRNREWKDELSLWEANYRSVPYSPRASYNLGGLYLIKDPEKAAALWRESIASDPGFEPAYLALAKLYVAQKRVPEAEELIQKGLDVIDSKTRSFVLRNQPLLRSQFTTALAAAKWEAGEPQETEQLLREAVSLYPGNMSPYEALANLYHNQDRGKETDVLKLALTANPAAYDIRARLAALAIERSGYDDAQDLLREMADLIPTDGDCEKARPYITAVKAGVPNSMERKQLSETVDLVLRQCVQR